MQGVQGTGQPNRIDGGEQASRTEDLQNSEEGGEQGACGLCASADLNNPLDNFWQVGFGIVWKNRRSVRIELKGKRAEGTFGQGNPA